MNTRHPSFTVNTGFAHATVKVRSAPRPPSHQRLLLSGFPSPPSGFPRFQLPILGFPCVAIRGRVGDRVFKTYRDKIVVTRVPRFDGYEPSAAQRARRARMRAATAFAKAIYADPSAKALYVAAAKKLGRQPFRLAVSDFLHGRTRVTLKTDRRPETSRWPLPTVEHSSRRKPPVDKLKAPRGRNAHQIAARRASLGARASGPQSGKSANAGAQRAIPGAALRRLSHPHPLRLCVSSEAGARLCFERTGKLPRRRKGAEQTRQIAVAQLRNWLNLPLSARSGQKRFRTGGRQSFQQRK